MPEVKPILFAPFSSSEDRQNLLTGLKLLSDDTRFRLVELLAQGEQCVCHLVDALELSQGTISHHLGQLRRAGWVIDRRDPDDYRWTYYSLNPARLHDFQAHLGQLLDLTRARPAAPNCCETDEP